MITKRKVFIVQMLLLFVGTVIIAKPLSETIVWKVGNILDRKYRWDNITKKQHLLPVAWMEIPEINLSTFVVAYDTEDNLSRYPCLADSSALKEKGLNVILGHRDMQFFKLKDLQDSLFIEFEFSDKSKLRYSICETEVVPKDAAEKRLNDKQDEDWLVLMTCHPFLFVGSAPDRFLVWAKKVEET
jgi:LPXTG-site transpeptidase (sortase) family protein